MPSKYTLAYREVQEPITAPVTKFGGQPVWLQEPCWPVSRMYEAPMQFICQIALDPIIFGELPTQMAYVFLTEWDYDSAFPQTFDAGAGENAVILQPGGIWNGPSLALEHGPSLYRRLPRNGRWVRDPCEFAVDLRLGEDSVHAPWGTNLRSPQTRDAYWAALTEDKIGGTPVPTISNALALDTLTGEWRLLLQVNAKDNEGNLDHFFLNLAEDGVGYALVSSDGRSAQFLWSR